MITCVAMMVRGKEMMKVIDDLSKSPSVGYTMGYFLLILGLLAVLSHNIWDGSLDIFITVLNWLILIKGATYLIVPSEELAKLWKNLPLKTLYSYSSMILLVTGFYMAKVGFAL
jgi:vacuolar-type H+-ATPase subunit I/STV1